MTARILAVLNQKGGVGKTTTCVNLGAALARRGKRVLLIDIDPQANMTAHVGLEPHRLANTTYSLLLGRHGLGEAIVQTSMPGLSIVPSTLALANAEIQLASTVGRELVLREALDEWLEPSDQLVDDDFGFERTAEPLPFGAPEADASENGDGETGGADIIIIDCPPSLGTLTMNALCAASEVVLPIQAEFFALQGVAGILESVRAVQRLNRGLRLSMVVPCMVDRRTTLARDVLREVREYFGERVTKTEIRKNVKLAEAPSHGLTIFEYEPRCNGALDYDSLAGEVLGEADESLDEAVAETPAIAGRPVTGRVMAQAAAASPAAAMPSPVADGPEPVEASEPSASSEPPASEEFGRTDVPAEATPTPQSGIGLPREFASDPSPAVSPLVAGSPAPVAPVAPRLDDRPSVTEPPVDRLMNTFGDAPPGASATEPAYEPRLPASVSPVSPASGSTGAPFENRRQSEDEAADEAGDERAERTTSSIADDTFGGAAY